jgi:hypothetical protein
VWHVKESSMLKAVSAKHRSRFAALSLVMVTVAKYLKTCWCDSKQTNKQTNKQTKKTQYLVGILIFIIVHAISFSDPRFSVGIIIFIIGYIINKWADLKLRSLRETKGIEIFKKNLSKIKHV